MTFGQLVTVTCLLTLAILIACWPSDNDRPRRE
jgi:hypothetical protein